jgi:hypothetical protein
LASGSVAAIATAAGQATAVAVAAGISPAEATAGYNNRVAELLSTGLSPAAAMAGAAQATQQMVAATTRSGPATLAQTVGDTFANPANATSGMPGASNTVSGIAANSAMAAALASGASPEKAMRDAATASATATTMLALATAPIQPGSEMAAALGSGVLPVGQANAPYAKAYADALAAGQDPQAAQAEAEKASATASAMDQLASVPPTEAREQAASLASGDLRSLSATLADGSDAGSATVAALSMAMATGRPMEEALEIAQKARASAQEQEARSTVPLSGADARIADLAAGKAVGGCITTQECALADARRLQLAEATVPVADPDMLGLAQGHVPFNLASASPLLRQLVAAPSSDAAVPQDAIVAQDATTQLITRLAQGTARRDDLMGQANGGDPVIFATTLVQQLEDGHSPEDAMLTARLAVDGLTRDAAIPTAPAQTRQADIVNPSPEPAPRAPQQ